MKVVAGEGSDEPDFYDPAALPVAIDFVVDKARELSMLVVMLLSREEVHAGLIILPNRDRLRTETLLREAIDYLDDRGDPASPGKSGSAPSTCSAPPAKGTSSCQWPGRSA